MTLTEHHRHAPTQLEEFPVDEAGLKGQAGGAGNKVALSTDQAQAIAHLKALGYKDGDQVFLRFINKATRKAFNGSPAKYPDLPWAEIEHRQKESMGVYIVANGQGHSREAVKLGKAIFYEHDDLDIELQLDLWERLGLPEPTIQINTGGKSIHSYWTLTEPRDVTEWEDLQKDLRVFSDGDDSIIDPSRVMRLAGGFHVSGDKTPVRSEIVSNSGQTYTFEHLRSLIPARPVKKKESTRVRRDDADRPEVSEIKKALSFIDPDCSYNEWLHIGMALHAEGSMHTEGDDLYFYIWDDWSQGKFTEKPSKKFDDNCEDKWDTFNANGNINIYKLFNIAKKYGYEYEPEKVSDAVKRWMNDRCSEYTENETYKPTGKYQPYSALLDEIDSFELTPVLPSQFKWDIVKKALPDDLIKALEQQNRVLGTPLHTSVVSALTALTADLSGKATVTVHLSSEWYEPLTLWSVIVGEPGTRKTPFTKQLEKPLAELNAEYVENYKCQLKEYKKEIAIINERRKQHLDTDDDIEEPVRRYAYLTQATTEKIICAVANNRNHFKTGFLLMADELAVLLGSLNKRGGSDDVAVFLSAWNGGSLNKSTLSGGDIFTKRGNCSILGGIQDSVWTKYCKEIGGIGDQNGFVGRWLTTYISTEDSKRMIFTEDAQESLLPKCIERHLEEFKEIGDDIRIGFESNEIKQYTEDVFSEGANRARNPNVYLKGKSNAFRLAGVMAMLNGTRLISKVIMIAAVSCVAESIRISEELATKGDDKSVDSIMDKAYKLAKRTGSLTIRKLSQSHLGNNSVEREKIIIKLHEIYGGELTKNRNKNSEWKLNPE